MLYRRRRRRRNGYGTSWLKKTVKQTCFLLLEFHDSRHKITMQNFLLPQLYSRPVEKIIGQKQAQKQYTLTTKFRIIIESKNYYLDLI